MLGESAKAEQLLAALEKLCLIPCEEYEDLKRAVSAYKRLARRAARIAERKLVVINPQPELDPMDREWAQVEEWARTLTTEDVRVLETRALFRLARGEDGFADRSFWPNVMQAADRKDDALMRMNGGSP